ncbi:MAG: sigma-70 family RNA polymerase sigma factor [Sedimentisphaerales bacterium]|nr:sigma-70 family RNA polymerase sigma factor [Sedimentisphaerales bacterium]
MNNGVQGRKNRLHDRLERLKIPASDKQTLKELLAEPIRYIPHDAFRRPKFMKGIMSQDIIDRAQPGQALSAEDEKVLFMQYNYAQYKMGQIRRKLLRYTSDWGKIARELLRWNQKRLECRSQIVTANMGLVLAMAKRSDFAGVEFTDLVSEGSMALLRATDKFDCSRGFKFSTYACRAIFKGFSRTAKQSYRHRSQFPAQWDAALEKSDQTERIREEQHNDWVDEVRAIVDRNLADLTGIEQSVVSLRFSLDAQQTAPLTLKQVGDKLGLTKERIRQIQNKALAKLRAVAQERMVSV